MMLMVFITIIYPTQAFSLLSEMDVINQLMLVEFMIIGKTLSTITVHKKD